MRVQMRLIQMGGNDHLISVCQKPLCKFYADGVRLLRRDLSGGKGLNHMIPFTLATDLSQRRLVSIMSA